MTATKIVILSCMVSHCTHGFAYCSLWNMQNQVKSWLFVGYLLVVDGSAFLAVYMYDH